MLYSAIVLAGGSGSRVDKETPKQFLLLAGKPVVIHTLEKVEKIERIDEVIIVCIKGYADYIVDYIEKYNFKKKFKIVIGGLTRQESVYNGLMKAKNENVIIHEAARPFVTKEDFEELISSHNVNAGYGVYPSDTILGIKNKSINFILNRDELIKVQLPQKFNKLQLLEAHEKAKNEKKIFTDDASLLYYYDKCEITMLLGKNYNLKLTTYLDFLIGEEIYKEYMVKNK